MLQVRATQRSFSVKFKLKLVKWSHENEDKKVPTARYFQENRKHVCEWIAECKMKSDELIE